MYDFHSWEHASSYLSGSVIRYNDEPVMVDHVDEENNLVFYPIKTLGGNSRVRVTTTELDDRGINMKPVPLGMFNFCNEDGYVLDSAYLSRVPNRGWKIGLTSHNMNTYVVRSSYDNVIANYRNNNLIKSTSFFNTVMNIYPTYQGVLEEFETAMSRRRSIAFSRNFTIIAEDRKLMYRYFSNPVGVALDNGPRLEGTYDLLSEVLNEDMNHG